MEVYVIHYETIEGAVDTFDVYDEYVARYLAEKLECFSFVEHVAFGVRKVCSVEWE